MKRKLIPAVATATATILALTACGGGSDDASAGGDAGSGGGGEEITLSWGGWDLDRVPEFRAMAKAFSDANENITVEVVDYPNAEWGTAMTADLAAGSAPERSKRRIARCSRATRLRAGPVADGASIVPPRRTTRARDRGRVVRRRARGE